MTPCSTVPVCVCYSDLREVLHDRRAGQAVQRYRNHRAGQSGSQTPRSGAVARRGIDALLKLGARDGVTVVATHPVFTPPALERLSHEAITRILVTDTIPFQGGYARVEVLSVAPLLAMAIRNVHDNASVSSLFVT